MLKLRRRRNSVSQGLSFYIHIPYCIRRCGYCDFNTYTPSELKGPDIASVSTDYIDAAILEIEMAAQRFGGADVPTIFFGGGTPSLLPARDLGRVVSAIRNNFSIAKDVEITIEVNPDSVIMDFLSEARSWGATRISMGMQSASPHVLAVLDRTHNPENVTSAVDMARRAGYAHVSVDLIYGSPGESVDDWRQTISSALALDIDHISAYALIVEEGTKFAKKVERGELEMPPDDETAEKYLAIDSALHEAGFQWYELSNWAKPGGECRHNINYWNGAQWWGVGPGAHSFVDNRRWWNVKHPQTYKRLIAEGKSAENSSETLTYGDLALEFIMLRMRMRSGIERKALSKEQQQTIETYLSSGHIDSVQWQLGRAVLTPQGRLIADRVVRELSL